MNYPSKIFVYADDVNLFGQNINAINTVTVLKTTDKKYT
jgi:hypothetical protein